MEANLSPGALASARSTTACTAGGTPAASRGAFSGVSVRTEAITARASPPPRQGRRPVSSS